MACETEFLVSETLAQIAREKIETPTLYVAASWRSEAYPAVLDALRGAGFECFDHRASGFSFDVIDPEWRSWSFEQLQEAYADIRTRTQFQRDLIAISRADALIAIKSAGFSVGSEFGFAAGISKPTLVLYESVAPDVLDLIGDYHADNIDELVKQLHRLFPQVR